LKDCDVLVLGSQDPWYESILLAHSAKTVVTMEYNNLTYQHPQILTTTPQQFRAARLRSKSDEREESAVSSSYSGPLLFDVILAISCVDHDGLGRYGDPIAPDGDLLTMDEIKGWIKTKQQRQQERTERLKETTETENRSNRSVSSGLLLLSAPIGPDLLVWNLERRYGNIRLPLLIQGWTVKNRIGWLEEKLTTAANFRQRYEPILILSPQETEQQQMIKSDNNSRNKDNSDTESQSSHRGNGLGDHDDL